jgi:predicted regulator of Ras-like GTPase activity (Roadblock/LC7/MglB family)
MDAGSALSLLTEISSQIRAAVLYDADGTVLGSTLGDDARSGRLAGAAAELLAAAREVSPGVAALTQLEVATGDGSVFLVGDGSRFVAAVTGPDPTVGLVFYDLKTCLRDAEAGGRPKRPRARRTRAKDTEPADAS